MLPIVKYDLGTLVTFSAIVGIGSSSKSFVHSAAPYEKSTIICTNKFTQRQFQSQVLTPDHTDFFLWFYGLVLRVNTLECICNLPVVQVGTEAVWLRPMSVMFDPIKNYSNSTVPDDPGHGSRMIRSND